MVLPEPCGQFWPNSASSFVGGIYNWPGTVSLPIRGVSLTAVGTSPILTHFFSCWSRYSAGAKFTNLLRAPPRRLKETNNAMPVFIQTPNLLPDPKQPEQTYSATAAQRRSKWKCVFVMIIMTSLGQDSIKTYQWPLAFGLSALKRCHRNTKQFFFENETIDSKKKRPLFQKICVTE